MTTLTTPPPPCPRCDDSGWYVPDDAPTGPLITAQDHADAVYIFSELCDHNVEKEDTP